MQSIGLSQQQLNQAALQYGTPLYLYNLEIVKSRYATLAASLPQNCKIYYALKANSNLTICRVLAQLGASAEVSSLGEFVAALRSGFAPESIVFTGPGKADQELSVALDKGIGLIVVESITEAQRVNSLAKQRGIKQAILLRINPTYRTLNSCDAACNVGSDGLQPIQMNGQGASKFGTDESAMDEAIATLQTLDHLQLNGIHIFTESNVLDHDQLLAAWQNTIQIADRLRAAGHAISTIDFGGGIGIAYNAIDAAFDAQEFGKQLASLFANQAYKYTCILEIGRYLVCEAGCYISEVVDVKQSQGQTFVIINGGVHNLYRTPAMQNASKYLEVLGKNGQPERPMVLAGKLPTPIDVIAKDVLLPEAIAPGDVIAIYNCGAYGFNHSLSNFVLHPHPAEVAYLNGNWELIRSRGTLEDFFARQQLVSC